MNTTPDLTTKQLESLGVTPSEHESVPSFALYDDHAIVFFEGVIVGGRYDGHEYKRNVRLDFQHYDNGGGHWHVGQSEYDPPTPRHDTLANNNPSALVEIGYLSPESDWLDAWAAGIEFKTLEKDEDE